MAICHDLAGFIYARRDISVLCGVHGGCLHMFPIVAFSDYSWACDDCAALML